MNTMAETAAQTHGARPDRQGRRRPFSSLMKRLAGFTGSSFGDGSRDANSKLHTIKMGARKRQSKKNNPYPESANHAGIAHATRNSIDTSPSNDRTTSGAPLSRDTDSTVSGDENARRTRRSRSVAPIIYTTADLDVSRSLAAVSHQASSVTGTSRTATVSGLDSRRGGDSTFSSPAPSVRSLTTTLNTIQSVGPNGVMNNSNYSVPTPHHLHGQSHQHGSPAQVIHFNQPFPSQSPASAIPAHLHPPAQTTYTTATANSLLTDNASILTLASSSKRCRRRSFDTDASVRALAPSSLFGGSRESLPLSVLSANIDTGGGRTSVYSTTAGMLSPGERSGGSTHNYPGKQVGGGGGDGASVRSGLLGHRRADSVTDSIGGAGMGLTSPLASPLEDLIRERGLLERGLEKDQEDEVGYGERVERVEVEYR